MFITEQLQRRASGMSPRGASSHPGRGKRLAECSILYVEAHHNVVTIKILLADDHTIIRSGLRLLLEQQTDFKVVAEAGDGRSAVELAAQHHPDVAVLDIGMPQLNGIEATQQIARSSPQTRVVILSMHSDEGYVLRALKAGARYILKNSADADLIRAVRAVADGKSFFSPVISKMLLEDYVRQIRDKQVEDSYDLLTPREQNLAASCGRSDQQRSRQPASPERLYGGCASRKHSAKTQPSRSAGVDSLCGPERNHPVEDVV